MSTKRRSKPTKNKLEWRSAFLRNLRDTTPNEPKYKNNINLSDGNSKIGRNGKYFKSAFVWNLPSIVTCPCASKWCNTHCYNADIRQEKFPVIDWAKNWWMYLNEPEILFNSICKQLRDAEKPCAVRIHSSGDFFSIEYIKFWTNIVASNPDVKFWTYTRSWADVTLIEELNSLFEYKNIQLFASIDNTMDLSLLPTWRGSHVVYSENEANELSKILRSSVVCPEQTEKIPNCASCGICITDNPNDIIFLFH